MKKKFKKIPLKKAVRMVCFIIVGLLALLGLPRLATELYARTHIYQTDNAPTSRVAIVFGAGLLRDGTPTAVLRDRVAAAAELYRLGKVEKLLMSGDNRVVLYNEPLAMYNYALQLGVPGKDVVLDYAGWRTYDTCYRARDIFGVSEALLVTQTFHLPRAILLCNALGIKASGVSADLRSYRRSSEFFWQTRELFATLSAFIDVWMIKPTPMLGKPEPIFPDDSKVTTLYKLPN